MKKVIVALLATASLAIPVGSAHAYTCWHSIFNKTASVRCTGVTAFKAKVIYRKVFTLYIGYGPVAFSGERSSYTVPADATIVSVGEVIL